MTDAHNDPGGVDDKPNEPTTEAGRRYLDSWDAQREVYTADADIRAIEQQARADLLKERDELRAALRDVIQNANWQTDVDTFLGEGRAAEIIALLSKSEEQEGGWDEALADPDFVKALNEGLADVEAGRVSAWQDVRSKSEEQEGG